MCGEQHIIRFRRMQVVGSPPRVRGTGRKVSSCLPDGRITPACAGNSGTAATLLVARKDHPRVCGEQSPHPRRCHRDLGSPPRVRGTGLCVQIHLAQKGITPACAGNRTNLQIIGEPTKDHPRVCGEQLPHSVKTSIVRITPACAGNSVFYPGSIAGRGDHPRVCGEQVHCKVLLEKMAGSPPRVRGTDCLRLPRVGGLRITPACAGNSCSPSSLASLAGDHPRVCGEQVNSSYILSSLPGSPPRVRGTGPGADCCGGVCRITPACAGNSRSSRFPPPLGPDHPRVCGEQPFRP